MGAEAWAAAPVWNPSLLCNVLSLSGRALEFPLRVEAFESEAAVITEEFMHPDCAQKKDGVIIIPLNPLALAPGALHEGHCTMISRVKIPA